jgi:ferritin-like protein
VEKVYEPKSIHLYRGTFIHSFIETLHNISLREQGINKNNFETKLEEVAQAQFTRMIDEPTNNFGNPGPTFRQQLVELFGDDEQAIDEALEDTAEMLNVYIQKKLIDLRVWTKKYNSFAKADRKSVV